MTNNCGSAGPCFLAQLDDQKYVSNTFWNEDTQDSLLQKPFSSFEKYFSKHDNILVLLQLCSKSGGCYQVVLGKSTRILTIVISKFKARVLPNCLKACWWSSAVDSSWATAVEKIQSSCQLLQAAVSIPSSSHHHHHHHHYHHHSHHHNHHRHIFKAASSWRKLPWQTAAIGTFPTMQSMLKILLSCVYWGSLVLRLLMF